MDPIVNEIFYFGAAVGGFIGAVHILCRRDGQRALCLALCSIVILLDALTWHQVREGMTHAAERQAVIEWTTGVHANAPDLEGLFEQLANEAHPPWPMHVIDIACIVAALALVAFAHNVHLDRAASFGCFVASAAAYCGLVMTYWLVLGRGGTEFKPLRDATAGVLGDIQTVACIVYVCYGFFFIVASVALVYLVVLGGRVAGNRVVRRGLGAEGEDDVRWALACFVSYTAATLYIWIGPHFLGSRWLGGLVIQVIITLLLFAARPRGGRVEAVDAGVAERERLSLC